MTSPAERYEFVVIGGGTAGAIVAARLSEDGSRRVLLLEAGADPDENELASAPLAQACEAITSGYNWDLQAIVSEHDAAPDDRSVRAAKVFAAAAAHLRRPVAKSAQAVAGRLARYPVAKVMGGGSAINGAIALHATATDYAGWVEAGNDRWGWADVQPFMQALACGTSGEPALLHESLTQCTSVQQKFYDACLRSGFAPAECESEQCGVRVLPKSLHRGRRASTAALYLPHARRRANLTVKARCLVDSLALEHARDEVVATSVQAFVGGDPVRFHGEQFVLCAGAIGSPAIRQRSGIGDPGELTAAGVPTRLAVPGVGRHLIDHPSVALWGVPAPQTVRAGDPVHQVMLRFRSAGSSHCDLQAYMIGGTAASSIPGLEGVLGSEIAIGVSAIVAMPRSRGYVRVVDRDPRKQPRISLGCLHDAHDLRRMKEAVRVAWQLMCELQADGAVRSIAMWSPAIFDRDDLLDHAVQAFVAPAWHPVGTLSMGSAADEFAVVDQHGNLRGCRNVLIADGSIMPRMPSVPTSMTCMVIGERAAAYLRKR